MQIIITEAQLERIFKEGAPLSKQELERRLNKAKKLAVKYSNPRQFALAHPVLWNTIRSHKLLDDVFPNRKKYVPDGYWNELTLADEASKYSSRSEFGDKNQVAYNKARELGILDDLFPEIKKPGRESIYTLEKAIELAKEFTGMRSEFSRKYAKAYWLLKANGIFDKYFPEERRRGKEPDESIIDRAKKYNRISDVMKSEPNLYAKLRSRGLLDTVFPKKSPEERLIDRAREYKNRYELQVNKPQIYYKLKELNLLNTAFPPAPFEKLSLSDLAKDVEDNPKED